MLKDIKKVYGPYEIRNPNSTNFGRRQVVIYYADGSRRTMLYSRHLMEQHLGRQLQRWEEVDHIDGDKTNDVLENLQVLSKKEHASADAKRVRKVVVNCIYCGAETYRSPRLLDHYVKQGKAGPFCSKSCVGKYGTDVQWGMEPLPVQAGAGPREYYKDKNS